MHQLPINELASLEELRGSPLTVYCTNDEFSKKLNNEDVTAFSRAFLETPIGGPMDLILHMEGGAVNAARALAIRMREHYTKLTVLIPHKAYSAGTLFCLGASEIVLGPLAEFSPIDPQLRGGKEASPTMPKRISAEDIRCFRTMAEGWFELRSEESRLKLFESLNQRIFPSTLAGFYRAEQYVRKTAVELLGYQLPSATPESKNQIVDKLLSGFATHQDAIVRPEIMALGLRARAGTKQESELMAQILEKCQRYMNRERQCPPDRELVTRGLFFSRSFGLRYEATLMRGAAPIDDDAGEGGWSKTFGRWQNIAEGDTVRPESSFRERMMRKTVTG